MHKLFYTILSVCIVGLTSCAPGKVTIPTDFEYVSTSLGLRNSGLLQPGQLYFLDAGENGYLIDLQEYVRLAAPSAPEFSQSRVARNVRGVSFGLSASQEPVSGEVKASFQNNVSFEVEDAERINHSGVWTALSEAYARDSQGNFDRWRVEQLVSDPRRYKLVVLVDPTYARREEINFSRNFDVSGSGAVKTAKLGGVSFSVDTSASASCKGVGDERATCFISAAVLEAYYVTVDGEKLLRFRSSRPIGEATLSNAFRKLS